MGTHIFRLKIHGVYNVHLCVSNVRRFSNSADFCTILVYPSCINSVSNVTRRISIVYSKYIYVCVNVPQGMPTLARPPFNKMGDHWNPSRVGLHPCSHY